MIDLSRLLAKRRDGSELFHAGGHSLGFDLLDFWRWSVSDLISNATRGRLAEYIVARALSIPTSGVRDEWAAFDLKTPDGIKVEVKSAAYLQSWHQSSLSKIAFRVRETRCWDPETGKMAVVPGRQADVYVFALLHHQDKQTIDPTDMRQWRFYVASTAALNARTGSPKSIDLKTLESINAGPIGFQMVAEAVKRAAGK